MLPIGWNIWMLRTEVIIIILPSHHDPHHHDPQDDDDDDTRLSSGVWQLVCLGFLPACLNRRPSLLLQTGTGMIMMMKMMMAEKVGHRR